MKLKDLKIGLQLKISFGIILALIVILGTISWLHEQKLAEGTAMIYDYPLKVRRALALIEHDVQSLRIEFRNYCLSHDSKVKQTAYQNYNTIADDIEIQFSILEKQYLGSANDIGKAKVAFIHWKTLEDQAINAVKKDADASLINNLINSHEIMTELDKFLMELKSLDNFANQTASNLYQESVKLKSTLTVELMILIILVLIISLIVISILMKNINTPLTDLERFANQFKEGKINARSNYFSGNEFGSLTMIFNELAETIETELTLNKKAADIATAMLAEEDAKRFCLNLLKTLMADTNSQVGAVYLLNEEKSGFECFESIGMDTNSCKSFSSLTHEGQFGQALVTRKMQHITSIPKETQMAFSTVSGTYIPREIITIPIVDRKQTVAVISLSSLRSYSNLNLRLLKSISSTLNARMNGILAYRKVKAFSEKLEYQNNELEEQKKELSAQAEELSEQNIELEMQKKQLDEANKLKTIFLSNMSHELRTPLNSVIALSGVLSRRLSDKIPQEEYGYLDVIERNGRHLLSLINDILDLARIESGREEIRISAFNMSELIHEVVELIKPQAALKNISLDFESGINSLMIKSDYEKCRHILQNLVANAVKFTEKGSVKITTDIEDEKLQILVADTGIGIGKEYLPHIFDEFRQADSSNSRKYGGTGLGLSIAKKYSNLLNGIISVDSTPGKGSKFMLVLPLNFTGEISKEGTYYSEQENEYYSDLPLNNFSEKISEEKISPEDKVILLVEDNDAIIIQMKDVLETQGYTVMVAHNGSEAFEQIGIKIPDAMILDLMMPGVDGFEVLKRIRENEITLNLPVIILTAKYVTKQEFTFLKHNNIRQVIRKGSINKDQLLQAVYRMITSKKDTSESLLPKGLPVTVSGTPEILIVEDNPDNRLTLKALLEEKYKIIEAIDGPTGLEMAKKCHPHLILMDIALPGINGIEVLKELKKDPLLKHIPVFAVSASAMKGDKENLLSYGFDAYIPKPINSNLLEKTLNQFLSTEFS
jgi:signal transduction histidine kinase/CheY-like chemotaxis protein/CHASE3 domain sensor protein